MKKIYKYGDCIPESLKVYNKLKARGKKPKLVEGWVEVSEFPDLQPDTEFLELYYPKTLKRLNRDTLEDNYTRVFQHTWVTNRGKIIDKTRNQFNCYGGILVYYEKGRYYFKGRKRIKEIDTMVGGGEIWEDNLQIHYPKKLK